MPASNPNSNVKQGAPKPIKVRTPKPTGPKSEVAASGGVDLAKPNKFKGTAPYRGAVRASYANAPTKLKRATLAKQKVKPSLEGALATNAHRNRVISNQREARISSPGITASDRVKIARYQKAHPTKKPIIDLGKNTGHFNAGNALGLALGSPVAIGGAALQGLGSLPGVSHTPVGKISKRVGKDVVKAVENVPADAAELAVTTPSSLYALGDTAIHHPSHLPGQLVKPYVQLVKHPEKTLTERPVSSALMVLPAGKLLDRGVGEVARATGKQSLKAPEARVAGTVKAVTRDEKGHFGSKEDHAFPLKEDVAPRLGVARRYSSDSSPKAVKRYGSSEGARPFGKHLPTKNKLSKGYVVNKLQQRSIAKKTITTKLDDSHLQKLRSDLRGMDKKDPRRNDVEAQIASSEVELNMIRHGAGKPKPFHHPGDERGSIQALAEAHDNLTQVENSLRQLRAREATPEGADAAGPLLRDGIKQLEDQQKALRSKRDLSLNAWRKNRAHNPEENRVMKITTGPKMTDQMIRRRVDEHYALRQTMQSRAESNANAAARSEIKAVKNTTGKKVSHDQKHVIYDRHSDIHQAAAREAADRAFVREFGSNVELKNGNISFKGDEGITHKSAQAATNVADRLPNEVSRMTVKAANPRKSARTEGNHAVVLKVAHDRLLEHGKALETNSTIGKLAKSSSAIFRRTVLPTSVKWMTGQAGEGMARTLVSHANPIGDIPLKVRGHGFTIHTPSLSRHRLNKIQTELTKQVGPDRANELLDRAAGGGFFGTQSNLAPHRTLEQELKGTPFEGVGRKATRAGAVAGSRHVHQAWKNYTHAVFNKVNGHLIESNIQKGMLGKAIKNSPLMEKSILGISDKAVKDAVEGLKGTHNQVALAREVHKMYGRYSAWSPGMRKALAYGTPFLPWYLNSVKFLTQVLPQDHLAITGLLADANQAEEQYRKAHRLSFHGQHVPSFLMGSSPAGGDAYTRISHFLPQGAFNQNIGQTATDLLFPNIADTVKAAAGFNWNDEKIRNLSPAKQAALIAETFGGTHLPLATAIAGLTGLDKVTQNKKGATVHVPNKESLIKLVDPFYPSKPAQQKKKGRKVSGKVTLGSGTTGKVTLGSSGSAKVTLGP